MIIRENGALQNIHENLERRIKRYMMKIVRWFNTYISMWRVIPAYIFFCLNRFRDKCQEDLEIWARYFPEVKNKNRLIQLGYLLVNQKEIRNIFFNRLHRNPVMFLVARVCFPPLESLYINMPPEKIGGGFSVQHGFSTIVAAKEIGKRCRIFQQVTIGYNEQDNPVIGDDVTIAAGAIVIGDVYLANNSVVGAGAVVIHDVPENTTVVGVPARVIGGKDG